PCASLPQADEEQRQCRAKTEIEQREAKECHWNPDIGCDPFGGAHHVIDDPWLATYLCHHPSTFESDEPKWRADRQRLEESFAGFFFLPQAHIPEPRTKRDQAKCRAHHQVKGEMGDEYRGALIGGEVIQPLHRRVRVMIRENAQPTRDLD